MKSLIIAGRDFSSRLFVGTGKFASSALMAQAIDASGSQMVTVALRRVDMDDANDNMLGAIDQTTYQLLPNTSGARDAAEAVRLSRLARAASGIEWVKLEVTPDPYYLLPDGEETLKAAKELVQDGFVVLPYINADPILAKKLQDVGCATVMPLASPIGSNPGMTRRYGLARPGILPASRPAAAARASPQPCAEWPEHREHRDPSPSRRSHRSANSADESRRARRRRPNCPDE